ncbi:MAG: hypothetical protein SOZ62_06855 [Eubacteriales bacterium]|nr:hypothetical protein [Eubacteriales bacterium]
MNNKFLSLIYPSEESYERHMNGKDKPDISEDVSVELGISDMVDMKNGNISDYYTYNKDVIEYRQKTFADMINIPRLSDALAKALPILCDILELRRLSEDLRNTSDNYLYSITEIELYVHVIDVLWGEISTVKDEIKSPAFLSLFSTVEELATGSYYTELNDNLKKLSSRIREVKSVTVGVNLDAQMRPTEAGIISVNPERFKSGKTLDKILRLSFKNDSFTCIASLTPFGGEESENQRDALVGAFMRGISEVYRHSVKDWRRIAGEYVLENTDFLLKLLPEIEFVSKCTLVVRSLESKGYKLSFPTVCDMSEKAFSAKELYNPDVALRIDTKIVENDFCFDDNGRIYILSGPNRGGKSVITCAVGLAQAMAQLGMPVCAQNVSISPCDAIFTHFPEGADDTIDKGRLGEECSRLYEIFERVTENSMILLDESLSSTGAYEASYIAAEILAGFASVGCRGVFSTHLHELAARIDEINERSSQQGGVTVDTLVAGIEDGERSFKIYRRKPDGKSYARDIANKYGLSYESIISRRKEKGTQPQY